MATDDRAPDEIFDVESLLDGEGDYGRSRYPDNRAATSRGAHSATSGAGGTGAPPVVMPRHVAEDEETEYSEYYDYDDYDSRDFVRVPRQRGVLRKLAGLSVLGVIAVLVAVVASLWWAVRQINPAGEPGELVTLDIPQGATVVEIGEILEEGGVVGNGRIFREFVRVQQAGPFDAGEYVLQQNLAMNDAIDVLEEGPALPDFDNVTLPEGLDITEIGLRLGDAVDHITADAFDVVAETGNIRSRFQPEGVDNLEGLLFPDTYRIEENETVSAVIQRMVDRMDEVAGSVGYDLAAARTGRTPYELIIIASMIEREARLPEEQPRIARVIYNRLEQGIPLGIDATSDYDRLEGETIEEAVVRESPYNTRLNLGLPPTPIASPGRSAMEAALLPAAGDWLYYVLADADGRHFFTNDFDAFLRQRDASRAAGLF